MTTLAELGIGQSGRIQTIDGDDSVTIRLLEMGLTPGAPVCVIGSSILGDPIEIEIRNYRLSVRKSEAARVVLEQSSDANSDAQ